MPNVKLADTCRYCSTPMPRRSNGYRRACPPCNKKRKLWYTYGITMDQYEDLLGKQGGLCAICLEPETHVNPSNGEVNMLSVDHDHSTGEIRGLLCYHCNQALGHFRDSRDRLKRARHYLKHSSTGIIAKRRTGLSWVGDPTTTKKKK